MKQLGPLIGALEARRSRCSTSTELTRGRNHVL
jgi:hypothetical protein